MSSPRPKPPPPGWGSDGLTAFLELAAQNRWATFHNKTAEIQKLARIDDVLERGLKDIRDPAAPISVLLGLRCHSAYRAACSHSLAGQSADIYPAARSCLEYAAYALFIAGDNELASVWSHRGDSEESRKAAKSAFRIQKIVGSIVKANGATAAVFEKLYETSIDFGAHPNEAAVFGNTAIERGRGESKILQIYLHEDGPQLDYGLRYVAQVGVCAVDLLSSFLGDRFSQSERAAIRVGL